MVIMKEEEQAVVLLEGQTWVWQTMLAFADSMALRCAVELGIADIIHQHGEPLSLPHLASLLIPSLPPNPTSLLRLMRFLVHKKIFGAHPHPNTGETLYGLTPASRLLVRSSDLSLVPMVLFETHPIPLAAWQAFGASIRQGGSPFVQAHGVDMLFGTLGANAEFRAVFNNAMACTAKGTMDAVVSAYKDGFEGLGSLVDVGGGSGATLGQIVRLHPGIKGTNFDLPHVIEGAPKYSGVTHVAGDMFEAIPPADAVFMKVRSLEHWEYEQYCYR